MIKQTIHKVRCTNSDNLFYIPFWQLYLCVFYASREPMVTTSIRSLGDFFDGELKKKITLDFERNLGRKF